MTLVTYLAPLVLMVVFAARYAGPPQAFAAGAERVILVAVLLHFALRYGLPRLAGNSDPDQQASDVAGHGSGSWRLLRTAGVTSLVVGLACVILTTTRILGVDLGFYLEVLAQQLTLVFIVHRVTKVPYGMQVPAKIACLVGLAGMAIFFAWSSNIVFLAQKPPRLPMSSDITNILYAVPVVGLVTAAITGLLRH